MTKTLPLRLQKNRPLSSYCTFQIGGPARYLIEATNMEELKGALDFAKEENLKLFILGKGSNCLFDDRGFNGLVIVCKLQFLNWLNPTTIHVGAGYSFSLLGTQTARKGLSGLEFASGIPGSVGGAVYMNAGANKQETADSLVSVDYLTPSGEELCLTKEKLTFGYRSSWFQSEPGIITAATFSLNPLPEARENQFQLLDYRKKTQPYSDPSAGCIFQNPSTGSAGALIEKCGLKGFRIGGAEVSTVHANFLINGGSATSSSMQALIGHVQKTIFEKTGIQLHYEVKIIPYD